MAKTNNNYLSSERLAELILIERIRLQTFIDTANVHELLEFYELYRLRQNLAIELERREPYIKSAYKSALSLGIAKNDDVKLKKISRYAALLSVTSGGVALLCLYFARQGGQASLPLYGLSLLIAAEAAICGRLWYKGHKTQKMFVQTQEQARYDLQASKLLILRQDDLRDIISLIDEKISTSPWKGLFKDEKGHSAPKLPGTGHASKFERGMAGLGLGSNI